MATLASPAYSNGTTTKRTVLCLHGFRTNSHVLKLQTQDLFSYGLMSDQVHPVYLDAPHTSSGPGYAAVEMAFPSCKKYGWREWYNFELDADGKSGRCIGIEESIALVEAEVAKLKPFAICGFSQGAVIAAIVAKNAEMAARKAGNSAVVAPFSHLLMLCAVPPRHFFDNYPAFVTHPISSFKTLHCIGSRDPMKTSSQEFAETAFHKDCRGMLVHTGNHKPPSVFEKAESFHVVEEFLCVSEET